MSLRSAGKFATISLYNSENFHELLGFLSTCLGHLSTESANDKVKVCHVLSEGVQFNFRGVDANFGRLFQQFSEIRNHSGRGIRKFVYLIQDAVGLSGHDLANQCVSF